MKIKGVIFDKDGTLIEFSDLWKMSLESLLNNYSLTDVEKRLIKKISGINEENQVKENSVLASGTISDLASIFSEYVDKTKLELEEEIGLFFLEYLKNHPEMVRETCNLKKLFVDLKEMGLFIGVITSDNYEQTKLTFEMLDLFEDLDFLATGDRYASKPDIESLDEFCKISSLNREEVVVVGDSDVDMLFGNKAGLSIGVLSGVGSKQMLEKIGDVVVDTPAEIIDVIISINREQEK